MRFLVVSDTHGDSSGLLAVLELLGPTVQGLIHCGDGALDVQLVLQQLELRLPVHLVRGNMDTNPAIPPYRPVWVNQRKLLVAHGHHYLHGDSCALMVAEAKRQAACAFLFGHTHIPAIGMSGNILLLNPGSLSRPRSSWGRSFAIMDVPEDKTSWIDVKFYELTTSVGQLRLHAFRP